jgi:hypothetical protein
MTEKIIVFEGLKNKYLGGEKMKDLMALDLGTQYLPDLDDITRAGIVGLSGVAGHMVIPRVIDLIPWLNTQTGYVRAVAYLLLGITGGKAIGTLADNSDIETGIFAGAAIKAVQDVVNQFTGGTSGLGLMTVERPELYNRPALGAVAQERDEFETDEISMSYQPFGY